MATIKQSNDKKIEANQTEICKILKNLGIEYKVMNISYIDLYNKDIYLGYIGCSAGSYVLIRAQSNIASTLAETLEKNGYEVEVKF